jgi:hypothetical protein
MCKIGAQPSRLVPDSEKFLSQVVSALSFCGALTRARTDAFARTMTSRILHYWVIFDLYDRYIRVARLAKAEIADFT